MIEPLLCAIDFETSGLDSSEDEIIEMGWAIFTPTRILSLHNYLIKPEKKVSPLIEDLTGLTNNDLETYGLSPSVVLTTFIGDLYYSSHPRPQYYVGHNFRSFDSKFLSRYVEDYFKEIKNPEDQEIKKKILNTEIIDTLTDMPYPETMKQMKLKYLALDHGYVNNNAHRALFDCLACVHIVQQYSFESIINLRTDELVLVEANCEKPWHDGGTSKDWAKSNGFRFNSDLKVWRKEMRKSQFENLLTNSPINLEVIQ